MSDINSIICIKPATVISGDILPGFEEIQSSYNEEKISCWNCTYQINMRNLRHIPIKYENEMFYLTGYFCCEGCCLRYIHDSFLGRELWEKYELYNFYYSKIYGKKLNIPIPPNKLFLKKFGGKLDIESYIKENNYSEIIIPSVIISPNLNNKNENNNENNHNLKLFRKKNKKSTILTNMS